MKGYFIKTYLLSFCLIFSSVVLFAQPANYWNISFSSEATMLGGAVVGGGSGITSIYYNPAGISEIENSNIALNTSMFTMSVENYKNAFGTGEDFTNYHFDVLPRFFSYVYRTKNNPRLSWQFALFSRDYLKVNFYETVDEQIDDLTGSDQINYLGSYNMEGVYDDYWGGVGAAYELNDHFRVGFSVFLSYKSADFYSRGFASLYGVEEHLPISDWSNYSWMQLWDLRALSKIGLRYEMGDMSIGMILSMPSVRLFGYTRTKREVSQNNIVTNEGKPVPDMLLHESTDYIYSQIKDPFSISVGIRRQPAGSKSVYYLSAEFFAKIKPYKMVDPAKSGSIISSAVYGTEFSTVYYGNRPVINIAFGYMLEMKESFELLFGFKSDFNSYYIPKSFADKHPEANVVFKNSADYFHLTGGANFIIKNKLKINAGMSLSYGRLVNAKQYINLTEFNWYNPEDHTALQGRVHNTMTYLYFSLGLIVGFSYDF